MQLYSDALPRRDAKTGSRGQLVSGRALQLKAAAGLTIPYEIAPRRAGDLPAVYADPSRAEAELGWKAELGIEAMCADTWRWQSGNPQGYPG